MTKLELSPFDLANVCHFGSNRRNCFIVHGMMLGQADYYRNWCRIVFIYCQILSVIFAVISNMIPIREGLDTKQVVALK